MPCELCQTMPKNERGVPAHENLEPVGTPRKIRMMGQATAHEKDFVCSTCGSKWTYQDDRNDQFSGWSLKA